MKAKLASIAALLFAASCSSSESSPGSTTAAVEGALPCDVDAVLAANCRSCHAAPPVYGAPMPLVTWADTQAPAKSDGSKKVWQMMKSRVHDAQNPMPSAAPLRTDDLATLDAWFAAGAPQGTAKCDAADAGPTKKIGPDYLPCDKADQRTFLAHGSGGGKFHVPQDAGNLYECFAFESPFEGPLDATAFAPVIDDARVVHHWILYETGTAQTDGALGPCKMPLDATFVTGWAPGSGNNVLPTDVGIRLGEKGKRWYILQLHYWNVTGLADADDQSGVAICTTKDLRKNEAAISTLGTLALSIPPKSTDVAATGTCTPTTDVPIHVIFASPHMHEHGKTFKTEILRGGSESKVDTLVDLPRWDFQSQGSYPADLIVNPGDVLRTTCTYDNPGSKAVYFGEKTEDEMCFDFVLAYPAGKLVNAGGVAANRCIDK